MIFFYLLLLFLAFIIIIFYLIFLSTPIFTKIPFVPVRKKVLKDIIESLELNEKSVLYDLGCGDARVLIRAAKMYPGIKCVGVERAPFPFILAKIYIFLSGEKNIKVYFKDMFKTDVSEATHLFLYLFPKFLDTLIPKFQKELKPGARVVSCDFKFSNKEPEKIIEIKSKSWQINRKLFVYKF